MHLRVGSEIRSSISDLANWNYLLDFQMEISSKESGVQRRKLELEI